MGRLPWLADRFLRVARLLVRLDIGVLPYGLGCGSGYEEEGGTTRAALFLSDPRPADGQR
ncbi:hypothetical protein BLA60_08155 [Actinophytocola xinjiangensis]|uniref:Uncharacterized protein n=1 Tax=Actinophytocola xinjiangensis TaxID=485602 RepID=A0A7Z0WPR1_9PSEU|nr:hypothetical protein BLA60_08155 [Actinophytocola xinjiangensis]